MVRMQRCALPKGFWQPVHLIGISAVLQQRLEDAIAAWAVRPQSIDEPLQRDQHLRRTQSVSYPYSKSLPNPVPSQGTPASLTTLTRGGQCMPEF